MTEYKPPRFLFRQHEILKNIKPGNNYLEIGPGGLMLTRSVIELFEKGTIIDYNSEVEKIYRELPREIKQKLTIHIGDFLDYNIDKNKYDCVICCEVLEHVENDLELINKVNKSLILGGQFVLSVPAKMKYWSYHDDAVGHLRRYERRELKNILIEAGFKNICIFSYGYPFVNLLQIPRVWLSKFEGLKDVSQIERTKLSGTGELPNYIIMLKYIINDTIFLPLYIFSSFFNKYDFSNGYIATCEK